MATDMRPKPMGRFFNVEGPRFDGIVPITVDRTTHASWSGSMIWDARLTVEAMFNSEPVREGGSTEGRRRFGGQDFDVWVSPEKAIIIRAQ